MLRSRFSSRWGTWMATTMAAATDWSASRIGTIAWIMSPLSNSGAGEISSAASVVLDVLGVGRAAGPLCRPRVFDVPQLLPFAFEDGDGGPSEPLLLIGE